MELVIWGLLVGMVGMMWLLVAASFQKELKDAPKTEDDPDQHPMTQQERTPAVHPQKQRAKAAA